MNGVVIKSTGSWYSVRTEEGQEIECRMKGKIRLKDYRFTNPVAVGDRVEIELEPGQNTAVIKSIAERKNYIIRKSNKLSSQTQVIAANIDQALLIATLFFPRTSNGFIDRFLLTAEAYDIPVHIVFNKLDLYNEEMIQMLRDFEKVYTRIGYSCLECSAKNGEGIAEIKNILQGKCTLLSGHSGVGKSSIINSINPEIGQKTAEVSAYSEKGTHTTTFAEMFEILPGSFIIDTPGIKELGIVDLEEQEISHYFPEMRALLHNCRFNNCRHIEEPGCAVLEAVHRGEIDESRYISYLSIVRNEDIHH